MNTKNMFWAVLSMTAALVMTACSSDDNDITEAPVAPPISKIIPYTVTVGSDNTTTRATVGENIENKGRELYFAEGDKLYITGTGIKGVLELQEGDAGKTKGVTFSGDLEYSGSEENPADDLELTATLVSAEQTETEGLISVDDAGFVTVNYPDDAYCSSINDAVQKYSNLTGKSTYGTPSGTPSFTLSQQTAFLNFEITFNDYTTTGKTLSAVVRNNGSDVCTANVTTTTEDNKVVAKFVLPVAAGTTTLNSATVKMGTKDAISFGASQKLTGKVYNVKKTQNIPEDAINGLFTIGKTDGNVPIKVFFSKGNLQATTTNNGTTWSWAFATNQWDYVGDNPANTKISGNGRVSEPGTVDLFGWVGSSNTTWTGGAKYGICITTTTGGTATYGNLPNEKPHDWGENIGDGTTWRTLTCAEWDYLFQTRTGGTVGSTSNARYTMATISTSNDGEVNGVILFPDGLNIEDKDLGDYFNTNTFSGSNINTATDYLTKCTSAQWTELEKKGCVFLPAAGWRNPTQYDNEGSKNGRYQSSSSNPGDASKNYAYGFTHYGSQSKKPYLGQYNNPKRYCGYSVRLVRAVE